MHLIDIPVCGEVRQVADTRIGAVAFHILVVPKREGVVVAHGEDDRIALFVERVEIVQTKVASGSASRTIVVIPSLAHHLQRYSDGNDRSNADSCEMRHFYTAKTFDDSGYTQTNPNGERIERTSISIVAFTRFARCLVEVKHNGKTCHKEEEEDHPKLLDTFLSAVGLPEEARQTKQQGQAEEDVMSLVVFQIIGQKRLISVECIVDEGDTGDPLSMFHFAIALNVILSTSEVPHEVAPVHEIHLIREEESEVVHLCGHFSSEAIRLSLIFSRNIYSLRFHTTEPFVVEAGVLARVHAREEHLLCTGEHRLCRHFHHIIAVRFVSVLLFVALYCLFFGISHSL